MVDEVKIPERCWIPIFVLNNVRKIVTRKKLQKLIFLIQDETRIVDGYEFKKHHFGPYSPSLAADVEMLSESGVFIREFYEGNHDYFIYRSTGISEEVFADVFEPYLENDLAQKVVEKLEKYGGCDHNKLTEYVYKKYLPDTSEYENRSEVVRTDLLSLQSVWDQHYSPECPLFIDMMSIIEYSNLLFQKDFFELDQVVKGVILVASEDLVENLAEVTDNHRCETYRCEMDEMDPSLLELFDFISYYCDMHDVLPHPDNLDLSELLTEEEIEKLEENSQLTNI